MKLFSSEYSIIYKIQNKRLKQYRNVPTRAHVIVVVVQVKYNTTCMFTSVGMRYSMRVIETFDSISILCYPRFPDKEHYVLCTLFR